MDKLSFLLRRNDTLKLCASTGPIVLFNRARTWVLQAVFGYEVLTTAATQRKFAVTCRLCRTKNLDLNLAYRFRTNPNLALFEIHLHPPERHNSARNNLGCWLSFWKVHVRCHVDLSGFKPKRQNSPMAAGKSIGRACQPHHTLILCRV
jgi:hypothetical protein